MSSILLVVVTDGRWDCIKKSIPSALANLEGPITRRIIHDDSGRTEYRNRLERAFPTFELIHPGQTRQGFGGAIRQTWNWMNQFATEDFVFWLEDDFLFNQPIKLENMMTVLNEHPYLAQLVLKRQSWSSAEWSAGGVVEQRHWEYEQKQDAHENIWSEHNLYWSTNPSLFRRSMCSEIWPAGIESEGHFTALQKTLYPDIKFAFWGKKFDPPIMHHIGDQRVGTGY